MAVCIVKYKLFGERLISYLERNNEEYDVTFSVGPEKVKVQALRLALMVTSPVFEKKFKEVWHDAVVRDDVGIPLPDTDPKAFAIFIKLLVADDISAESLEPLKFPIEILMNVILLCKQYNVPKMEKIFNQLAAPFFQNFESFMKSPEFLNLSLSSLELILSSDQIPVDEVSLFKSVCTWADAQCGWRNGENTRNLLGKALFQIRFPLMCSSDFENLVCSRGILTGMEEFKLRHYISLNQFGKAKYDTTVLPFKTMKREVCQTEDVSFCLKLLNGLTVADYPAGVCDGKTSSLCLRVDRKIAIHSVGFLGPVDGDGLYDAKIEFRERKACDFRRTLAVVKCSVLAKQRQVFHFPIEPPFVLYPTYVKDDFDYTKNPYHYILFNIKGNNTQTSSMKRATFRAETDEVGFYCYSSGNQLAEIIFKTC